MGVNRVQVWKIDEFVFQKICANNMKFNHINVHKKSKAYRVFEYNCFPIIFTSVNSC